MVADASLALDPKTTAVVLIDLQRGILEMPLEPRGASDVVAAGVSLARAAGEAGGTVVLVHVGFSADGRDGPARNVDAPTRVAPGYLPPDHAEFAPDVAALHADAIVLKRGMSAFFGTELELQLRRRTIATIVLAGVATNFGVEGTARDAWQMNYDVIVAEDACASATADLHRFAIERILPRFARIRGAAEIAAALQPRRD